MRLRFNVIDRLFRRTILLQPNSTGFDGVDITGEVTAGMYKDGESAVHIDPGCVYRVGGIPRVAYVCIQQYGSTELQNIHDTPEQPVMSEHTLGRMLEMAELAGKEQGAGFNDNNTSKILTLLAAVAAVVSILIYLKLCQM